MSKDNSFVDGSISPTHPISSHWNSNQNDPDNCLNQTPFPPPSRTPLNSIPDPSQLQYSDQNAKSTKPNSTPKIHSTRGGGKLNSEPSSAQSTPSKLIHRLSNVAGKAGSFSRVSRGISTVNPDPVVQVPHFELPQDHSFWKDYNVQVMIRIRPLSNTEKLTQGYGRCLRQESAKTLVWLGQPETRFTFDHIACETISQEELFTVAGLPMVENCMSGYNSCMFAYGQTGSGKTYTMMGDIGRIPGKLNEDCGITPRIFEYLFTRIRKEEDQRRNGGLKYSCKCSFLEIYNEQITDLLEPSSNNLQLREDMKKGVYVENLTEYNVRSVDDVLRLLLQGAANRKMAATHMNSESSRSHSVFTCIIESRWGRDSMTHLRFGRLNLVDLAGSERQKSSGAEGDRLKEAANINKSLSTLGLVIMSLVDLAQGKHRHVPYRDSRLTFLLQDSLGGNSKTTIIANVSPSICSANETLSTLKFAQRAKLIQNNAKVNEDASGDVIALQRQIQQLKGQLSVLLKHSNYAEYYCHCAPNAKGSCLNGFLEGSDSAEEMNLHDNGGEEIGKSKEINCSKATLLGTLQKKKLAEMEVKRLEGEVEHMNRLVHQLEEDAEHTKFILRFRDEKIKCLELLADGLVSADNYLLNENKALRDEIELLQSRIRNNPEAARSQDFYGQGERETLLAEISELRDELSKLLEVEESFGHSHLSPRKENQETSVDRELKEQRNMNSKLVREVDELQSELRKLTKCNQPTAISVGVMPPISESVDKLASYILQEDCAPLFEDDLKMERALTFQCNDIQKELMDARSLIEAMESKEVTIEELEFLRNWNHNLREMLNHKKGEHKNRYEPGNYNKQRSFVLDEDLNLEKKSENKTGTMVLQAKLDKLSKDLKEMQLLNSPYLEDNAMELPRNQQTELFEEEVETEITKTILHLQEEIAAMQSELNGELLSLAEENQTLRDCVAAKEDKIKAMCSDWERATLELTTFLIDGSKSLRDASSQIESIACLFPCVNVWIGEHVEKAAKLCIEKEERIFLLKRCLEDAQKTVLEMDQKLNSLRGATMALTEVHQMKHMENNLMNKENCIIEDETYHPNNFLEMKRYSHQPVMVLRDNIERDTPLSDANTLVPIDVNIDIELALSRLLEVDNTIKLTCFDAENHFAFLQSYIHETFSLYKELVQDLVNNIHGMRRNFVNLKVNCGNPKFGTSASSSVHSHKFLEQENEQQMLHKIRDDLTVIIDRLNSMSACFCGIAFTCGSVATAENLAEADGWSTDFSTSSSNSLAKSALGSKQIALNGYDQCLERKTKQMFDQEFEEGSVLSSDYEELEHSCRVVQGFNCDGLTLFSLRKEFRAAYDAFAKIDAHLTAFFSSKPTWDGCTSGLWILDSLSFLKNKEQHGQVFMPEMGVMVQDREKIMQIADASSNLTREANSFFTKFEEAQATVKEADYMLNALLKSNEDAKQLTSFWKQAGNELMIQIANLVEEIKQLKSSIQLRESKIELLHNKIDFILTETEDLMFLVENSFIKDMDDLCKRAYSEAILMVKETLNSTYSFRSLLEDITSKVKENGIFSFVLYCCSLGAHSNEFSRQNTNSDFLASTIVERYKILHNSGKSYTSYRNESKVSSAKGEKEGYQTKTVGRPEVGGCDQVHDNLINENLELKKELERKEVLLKGLLFDFSLLQESASSRKDVKDEIDKLILVLNQVQDELKVKTSQLDNLLMRHRTLEGHLNETENALSISNSDLDQVRGTLDILSEENAELRMILKDLYLKKSETEQQLEEKRETVKDLENEIFRMASSAERKLASSLKDIKDDMDRVTVERDQLLDQLQSLQDKLDIAYALADEKEAICIEARQESEASKAYAKQKEEEVKILEHSIEELEYTINALEKKVYEMEEEVERHRMIRDSSEVELHNFRERLLMVESITEDMNPRSSNRRLPENEFCRQMQGGHIEVYEAHDQIKALEEEKQKLAKEIQQYREYISELVVHAEAQASQYQQKYKNLEAMVHEVRTDSSNVICGAQMSGKMEKTSVRSRGSSSPFRCIANLVQQTNMEKDQELSNAKSRIQELEALVATRQKEVCLLNTRLASVESMTHDVIRDLLGVKLEITNYADLVSQNQLQKLVEEAQQQAQQYIAMEREVLNLKGQIDDLTEERERCILEVNGREADVLAAHMLLEQVRERDQLLTVQNEMLKADKTNLQRRVAELDDMVKKLIGTQNIGLQKRQQTNSLSSVKANSFGKKLSY